METNKAINGKDPKGELKRKLYKLLLIKPISRRMAATELGKIDQTFSVTGAVSEWLKNGKAQVVKMARCERSNEIVGFVTTNSALFVLPETNQLDLFE
jgi:hypothetical protein